jgi:hypothetical protein
MKNTLSFATVAIAAAVAFTAPAQAAHFTGFERYDFTVDLTGDAAGTSSDAFGSGTFSRGVDDAGVTAFADYSISFTGFTATALHFHRGFAGVNGGVLLNIATDADSVSTDSSGGVPTSTYTGRWNVGDQPSGQPSIYELVGILGLETVRGDSGIYVNIHSAAFPSGEIRGQVTAPIPLPAALPLMAVGLAGLGMVARRRKNA